jgi:lipoyl(octanoyl) transferase
LDYTPAAEIQRQAMEAIIAGEGPNTLFFVEHSPVFTLGAAFHSENLLLPLEDYEKLGIQMVKTERGGDVTFHGLNQLVTYPVFNVAELGKDIHKWMRDLEEVIIRAILPLGLNGGRSNVNTGVWLHEKKVAAIGVKIRRWVSMHGIALNCDNDLRPFQYIVPCGIRTHGVTSLSQELGRPVTVSEMKPLVKAAFEEVFDLKFDAN